MTELRKFKFGFYHKLTEIIYTYYILYYKIYICRSNVVRDVYKKRLTGI